jgi:ADP-ribose pyrophosphatase
MSKKENQDPKPELEENEFIEVFSVPLSNFYSEMRRLEKDGFAIDARVGTLAEGLEVAKKWRLY